MIVDAAEDGVLFVVGEIWLALVSRFLVAGLTIFARGE